MKSSSDAINGTSAEYESVLLELPQATSLQFLWLCLLFLSFNYELPLAEVTSMDRVNPRIFDVISILGCVAVLPGLSRQKPLPKLFKCWVWIVAVFGFCAIAWVAWIPLVHYKYSLFFLFRYLQGLLMIYMALKINWSPKQKRILQYLVAIGGTFVALYCIPEYLHGGGSRMAVESADKEIVVEEGTLLGCLGSTYFHLVQLSSMASIMAVALIPDTSSLLKKILYIFWGIFICWPALFSGCRTGLVLVLLSWGAYFLLAKMSYKITSIVLILLLLFGAVAIKPQVLSRDFWEEKSHTFKRLFEKEESQGQDLSKIWERLKASGYDISLYRWQGFRIPFIGAGFHACVHTREGGDQKWRYGYGIHNCYFFALEQGGLGVFILFFVFLVICHRELKKIRKTADNESDRSFAMGMHSFYYALIPAMVMGQIFWQGFGTVNFNTYLIMLFCIATVPTGSSALQAWEESGENSSMACTPVWN